jgi:hypothetical protein
MEDDEIVATKDCAICDAGLAAVGLILGGIFIYIAVDVLSGGKLTSAITRGVTGE